MFLVTKKGPINCITGYFNINKICIDVRTNKNSVLHSTAIGNENHQKQHKTIYNFLYIYLYLLYFFFLQHNCNYFWLKKVYFL